MSPVERGLRLVQARWEHLSLKARVGWISGLLAAGLLFWIPTVVHGLQRTPSSMPQLSDLEGTDASEQPAWRSVSRAGQTHPLLRSVRPEELARDPFADDVTPEVSDAPSVPKPVDAGRSQGIKR